MHTTREIGFRKTIPGIKRETVARSLRFPGNENFLAGYSARKLIRTKSDSWSFRRRQIHRNAFRFPVAGRIFPAAASAGLLNRARKNAPAFLGRIRSACVRACVTCEFRRTKWQFRHVELSLRRVERSDPLRSAFVFPPVKTLSALHQSARTMHCGAEHAEAGQTRPAPGPPGPISRPPAIFRTGAAGAPPETGYLPPTFGPHLIPFRSARRRLRRTSAYKPLRVN